MRKIVNGSSEIVLRTISSFTIIVISDRSMILKCAVAHEHCILSCKKRKRFEDNCIMSQQSSDCEINIYPGGDSTIKQVIHSEIL